MSPARKPGSDSPYRTHRVLRSYTTKIHVSVKKFFEDACSFALCTWNHNFQKDVQNVFGIKKVIQNVKRIRDFLL
jgi:hypothetical protein